MTTSWNADEQQPMISNNGLEGGWPIVGTVWQGTDSVSGRFQRVRIEENLSRSDYEGNHSEEFYSPHVYGDVPPDDAHPQFVHEGAASVVVLGPEPDAPDADLISWPQFGTDYAWVPDDPEAHPGTSTNTLTGIRGGRPIEGTVWAGLWYGGDVEAFRADLNLLDTGETVTVDMDTGEAGLTSWTGFGTDYTWLPDHPQTTATTAPAELRALVIGHDPGDLTQRWEAMTESPPPDVSAEPSAAAGGSDDDTVWRPEQTHQIGRGPHL